MVMMEHLALPAVIPRRSIVIAMDMVMLLMVRYSTVIVVVVDKMYTHRTIQIV